MSQVRSTVPSLRERIVAAHVGVAIGDIGGESVESLPASVDLAGARVKLAAAWEIFPPMAERSRTVALKARIWERAIRAGVAPDWARRLIVDREPYVPTDDTNLLAIVSSSMAECGGWNLRHQVQSHVDFLDGPADQWGPTIRAGIVELHEGGRDIDVPARRGEPKTGMGNGPTMRVLPLALWHAQRREDTHTLMGECFQLGLMTHWDVRASVAAFALARFAELVARRPLMFVEQAKLCLEQTIAGVRIMENEARQRYPDNQGEGAEDTISGRLTRLLAHDFRSHTKVAEVCGTEGHSLMTTPYTIGMACHALTRGEKPHQALVAAIKAGGDTDTNGALIGGLIGTMFGWGAFPRDWREHPRVKPHAERMAQVGLALYNAAHR